jgi:hypothetical protein
MREARPKYVGTFKVLGIMAGLVGAFVSQFQFTGNVSVFSANSNQVLFKLGLGSNEGVVESGHFGVFGCKLTKFLFSNLLGIIGLLKDLE